jgi:hypothetical protein
MAHLALGGLGPILDLRQQRRLDPDRLVRDLPGIGLGFSDQRRQPLSQVGEDDIPPRWYKDALRVPLGLDCG